MAAKTRYPVSTGRQKRPPPRSPLQANVTRIGSSAAVAGTYRKKKRKPTNRVSARGRRSRNNGLLVGEDFALELFVRLTEDAGELLPAVLDLSEGAEIGQHTLEPVAPDQIVGHQEGELIRGQRPLPPVAQREPPRRAERLEVEPGRCQCRMVADAAARHDPALGQRVEPQSLQHREGDPLRHALGEPPVS